MTQQIINNIKLKRKSYYFPGISGRNKEEIIQNMQKDLQNMIEVESLLTWQQLTPTSSNILIVNQTDKIIEEANNGKLFEGKGNGAVFLYFFSDEIKNHRIYDQWNEYLQNTRLLKFSEKMSPSSAKNGIICKFVSNVISALLMLVIIVFIVISKKIFSLKIDKIFYGTAIVIAILEFINSFWHPISLKIIIKKFKSSLCNNCERLVRALKKNKK
jgi:hypothetical protein